MNTAQHFRVVLRALARGEYAGAYELARVCAHVWGIRVQLWALPVRLMFWRGLARLLMGRRAADEAFTQIKRRHEWESRQ